MYVYRIIYKYTCIYVQSTTSMPTSDRLQILGAEEEIYLQKSGYKDAPKWSNVASANRVYFDSSTCTS